MSVELIAVVLVSMVVHEWAHAQMARREGDFTPWEFGRLTLNPLAHLDPFGTVLVPVVTYAALGVALGWCRPVPINLALLRRGRRSHALVLAAGPAANLVLAGLFALVGYTTWARVNLALAAFNLIPIGSLDGCRLLRLALNR